MKRSKIKIISVIFLCLIIIASSVAAIGYSSWKKSIAGGQIHFSVDDVIDVFADLTKNQNQYTSIFDNENLAFLKKCHTEYGAKFVLYCFYEYEDFNLSMVPDKYRSEFSENSDWLSFGFHYINSEKPTEESEERIVADYQKLTDELMRITGSVNTTIRLSYFMGSYDTVCSLGSLGVKGLLTADDDRQSYYFNEETSKFMNNNDTYSDETNGMKFISTDMRLEKVEDDELYSELTDICLDKQQNQIIAVFTHEYVLDESSYEKIENICRFADFSGYEFTIFE